MKQGGRLLIRGLVVAAMLVGAVVGFAPSADAHTGTSKTANGCLISIHNQAIGSISRADAETCATRDNYFRGRVRDDHAPSDGSCVYAEFTDTLTGPGVIMASSCNSSGTGFTFLDPQRNFRSWTWVCRSRDDVCYGTQNINY